jgi:hypothetical protein
MSFSVSLEQPSILKVAHHQSQALFYCPTFTIIVTLGDWCFTLPSNEHHWFQDSDLQTSCYITDKLDYHKTLRTGNTAHIMLVAMLM